ncbi:hypothetical protein [Streptomyces acidicola]|uniref:hypothetical protein n=1 Tax=Streptomyces acidicola TaxID=2596892 RepID=UPI0018833D09|nr:hypothetical protein [Streptomyces acidicola]
MTSAFDHTGRVALIAGSSRGIGPACPTPWELSVFHDPARIANSYSSAEPENW